MAEDCWHVFWCRKVDKLDKSTEKKEVVVARKKAWDKAKAKALKVVEVAKKAAKAAKEKVDDMIKKHDVINKLNKIALQEGKCRNYTVTH